MGLAQNLVERLVCEAGERIGIEEALVHPFFVGGQAEDLDEEELDVSVQRNIENLKKSVNFEFGLLLVGKEVDPPGGQERDGAQSVPFAAVLAEEQEGGKPDPDNE